MGEKTKVIYVFSEFHYKLFFKLPIHRHGKRRSDEKRQTLTKKFMMIVAGAKKVEESQRREQK